MQDLLTGRHMATHGATQGMSALLTLAGAQTINTIFFPFLRRNMGSRYWNIPSILAGLFLIIAAACVRLMLPQLNAVVSGFLPTLFSSFRQMHSASIRAAAPNPYNFWFVIVPFVIFAVVWLRFSLKRLKEAKEGEAKKRHSKSTGWSVLENYHKEATTRRVQCFYEPLYFVGAGFGIGLISPALGSFILWAAIPHVFSELGVWRSFKLQELDAIDMQKQAEFQEGVYEKATMEQLARQFIQQADEQPETDAEPNEQEGFEEALQEIPEDIRAKFLEKLKKGK